MLKKVWKFIKVAKALQMVQKKQPQCPQGNLSGNSTFILNCVNFERDKFRN